MFKNSIALMGVLALSFATANGHVRQSIEVVNHSANAMTIGANSSSFNANYTVPALTKSLLIFQLTALKSLQDMLFTAIVNNSAEGIREAMILGANVNCPREGKSLLLWAVTLQRSNAARCLLEHGAI